MTANTQAGVHRKPVLDAIAPYFVLSEAVAASGASPPSVMQYGTPKAIKMKSGGKTQYTMYTNQACTSFNGGTADACIEVGATPCRVIIITRISALTVSHTNVEDP